MWFRTGAQVESVPWSEYVQAGLTERYPQLAEVLEVRGITFMIN